MTAAIHAPGVPHTRHAGHGRTEVRVSHTDPGDDLVEVTASHPLMACSAFLDARRLRELAADLIERADVLDPAGRTS